MRRGLDSLAWGLVGGLSFLVLVQGYELLDGLAVGPGPKAGVAAAVTAVTAALAHALAPRLAGRRGESESD